MRRVILSLHLARSFDGTRLRPMSRTFATVCMNNEGKPGRGWHKDTHDSVSPRKSESFGEFQRMSPNARAYRCEWTERTKLTPPQGFVLKVPTAPASGSTIYDGLFMTSLSLMRPPLKWTQWLTRMYGSTMMMMYGSNMTKNDHDERR